MTKKQVLQHLLERLNQLQQNIELIVDVNNLENNSSINIVRLQSYLEILKDIKNCKDIIDVEMEKPADPNEVEGPFNQKEYLTKVADLSSIRTGAVGKRKRPFSNMASDIGELLNSIKQDQVNLSVSEEGLSALLDDVFNNDIWGLDRPLEEKTEIKYEDPDTLLGKEPDVRKGNLDPLPIDPAEVSEFKPEINMENKEAFDKSFRQFLWLAMTDSKVSLFVENHPEKNQEEKQAILNDWQNRNAKKALDNAITWLEQKAPQKVKQEYIRRLSEIDKNTVSEYRENEFDDLDKDALKAASTKNMIESLSKKRAFRSLSVSEELKKIGRDANYRVSGNDVDYHSDKYRELAYGDPEYSTYIGAANRCKLVELYTRLINLEREGSSAYFKDMVQSVRKVLTTPYSSFDLGNEQLTKDLGMCELTCHKYLDTHKALPITQDGRDRVALAKSLRDLSQDFCRKSWKKIKERVDFAEQQLMPGLNEDRRKEISKYWMDDKELEGMMTSSKLMSTVQPMRFRPSMHKKVPTFSLTAKFHAFISKIASIIPLIFTPSALFTTHAARKAMKLTDEEVKNKVIEALPAAASPQNVDKETKDVDGTILDKRRIPLIWSKEIPDDPDQDIELTVNVEQAIEGEDYAFGSSINNSSDPNTRGNKKTDAGHGFFTLKYTSTDPVTGQKRRYQTQFGFGGGEYEDDAALVDWYLTDSMIQGSIHNDDDKKASIGRSFKITPEQFNKLIEFTEGYPKGGYNLMKRNCCTFLADACKEIGLKEVEKYFVEGDANLPVGLKFALAGATVVTPIASIPLAQPITHLVSTKRAAQFVGTPSYDYQKFGESLVTPNDIKQMQSHKGIATLHGYSPGAIGERMRSEYGQNFHSNHWLPKITAETESSVTGELRLQGPILKKAIQDRMTPIISKMKPEEQAEERERLNSIFNAIDQNYNRLGMTINAGIVYLARKADTPDRIRKVAAQLRKATKLYRENILSIYHNGLKSDDKLNVEFAHYISTIDYCDRIVQLYFDKGLKELANKVSLTKSNLGEYVDIKREAVGSLACVVGASEDQHVGRMVTEVNPETHKEETNFIGSDGTPFGLLSVYDVCETMEEYINAPDEKKYLVNEFINVNALKADINTPFTEREIRMMFNQIPKDEEQYTRPENYTFPVMRGSDVLKGFLFEKYFSGFGPQIRKEADKFVALDADITIKEEVAQNVDDDIEQNPDELIEQNVEETLEDKRIKSVFADMIEKGFEFVDGKLARDLKAKESFDIMVDATMDRFGYSKVGTPEEIAANRAKAEKRVKLDIVKDLFVPQFLYQASRTLPDYSAARKIQELRGEKGSLRNLNYLNTLPGEYNKRFESVFNSTVQLINQGAEIKKENIYEDYIASNYEQRLKDLKARKKQELQAENIHLENIEAENRKGKNNEPQLHN